jgi:replicative DNA helicase
MADHGDPIVSFHHIKQPAAEVGPYKIIHDHDTGKSKIWHSVDLSTRQAARRGNRGRSSHGDIETGQLPANEKAKARRKLDKLVGRGLLKVIQKGDAATTPQ